MKRIVYPSQDVLWSIFDYDPETGILTWKVRTGFRVKVGDVAGCPSSTGHLKVTYNKVSYLVHRIIWIMMQGSDPDDLEVEHWDRVPSHNQWDNLRLATRSQNAMNTNTRRRENDLPKGVYWSKRDQRYQASIMKEGKFYFLGYFDTPEKAAEVRQAKERELFGQFSTLAA